MGNTVVWKPTPTQQVAAHHTMRLLEAAGLPAGVINMVTGDGLAVSRVALDRPGPGRPALHRLVGDLQDPVADDRGQPRPVPQLPADRRRDRRQGLRRRPPVGGPGAADHRARPRRVRVPGPEVLGRLPGLRAPQHLAGRAARRAGRRHPVAALRRRHRPDELRRRRHRRPRLRPAPRGAGPGQAGAVPGDPRRRRHRRQRGLVRRARPCWSAPTRPTRRSPPSTSARSSPCTSTTTPSTPRRSTSSTGPARTR